MEIFSARIKWLRNNKGLTQSQVAEAIGMSGPGYTKVEQGTREMKFETLVRLPKILNASLDFMLGVTDYDYEVNKIVNSMYAAAEELRFIVRNIDRGMQYIEKHPDDTEMFEAHRLEELNLRADHKRNAVNYHRKQAIEKLKEIPFVSEDTIKYLESYDPLDENYGNNKGSH